MGGNDVRLFLQTSRPADRRQELAKNVASTTEDGAAANRDMAQTSAPRWLLEARVGVRKLECHRSRGAVCRRMERRLFERRPTASAGIEITGQGHHRALGA